MKCFLRILVCSVCLALNLVACGTFDKNPAVPNSIEEENLELKPEEEVNCDGFTFDEISAELDHLDIEKRFGDLGKVFKSAFLDAITDSSGRNPNGSLRRNSSISSAVTDLTFDQGENALYWSYVNPGDYDTNGLVDVADIIPIAENYLAIIGDGAGNEDLEKLIDGDGNGEVGISDVTLIAQNYLSRVDGYSVYGRYRPYEEFEKLAGLGFDAGTGNYPRKFKFELSEDSPRFLYTVPFDAEGDRYPSGKILDTGNRNPIALLNADKTGGIAPLTVTFDARNSSDTDGSIMSYKWIWREEEGIDGRFDNFRRFERTFGYPGEYDVTAIVRDNEGAQASATVHITVSGEKVLYEAEPNNSVEEANPLPELPIEAGIVKGSIGSTTSFLGYSGDYEDWYSFSVPESGFVRLYIGHSANLLYEGKDNITLLTYDLGGPGVLLEAHLESMKPAFLRVYGNPYYQYHSEYDIYGSFSPQMFKWNYFLEPNVFSEYSSRMAIQNHHLNALCINGTIHAAFMQYLSPSGEYSIVYATYSGAEWNYEPVMHSPNVFSQIKLQMDSANSPCIAFYEQDTATGIRTLNVARKSGSTWNHQEIDSIAPYMYGSLGFAIDNNDNLVLAYADYDARLLRIIYETDEGIKTFNTRTKASLDSNIAVAIDHKNAINVFYNRYTSSHVTWGIFDHVEYEFETISDLGNALDMAIDKEGKYHLLYNYEAPNIGYNITYSIGQSGSWNSELVWDKAGYGSIGKILMDREPRIIVGTKMYRDYADLVHYITRENGQWVADKVEIMASGMPTMFNYQGKDTILYAYNPRQSTEFHLKWAIRE